MARKHPKNCSDIYIISHSRGILIRQTGISNILHWNVLLQAPPLASQVIGQGVACPLVYDQHVGMDSRAVRRKWWP